MRSLVSRAGSFRRVEFTETGDLLAASSASTFQIWDLRDTQLESPSSRVLCAGRSFWQDSRAHLLSVWSASGIPGKQEISHGVAGECLLLDFGNMSVPNFPCDLSHQPDPCSCGHIPVVQLKDWLFWDGRPFLWLPPGHMYKSFALPNRRPSY